MCGWQVKLILVNTFYACVLSITYKALNKCTGLLNMTHRIKAHTKVRIFLTNNSLAGVLPGLKEWGGK